MRTKFRRSIKDIENTIGKYYPDAKYREEDEVYISQKAFVEGRYRDYWEIATHVLISSFNRQINNGRIHTGFITKDFLYGKFNIINGRKSRIKKKIDNAIESLEEREVISIERFNDDSDYFIVVQNNVLEYGGVEKLQYYKANIWSIEKILLSSYSDDEKSKLLAVYASIVSTMNDTKSLLTGIDGPIRYDTVYYLSQMINASSEEKIGEKSIIKSNKTIGKYTKKLCDMNIIARIKVHKKKDSPYQWSYYYSKYNERFYLKEFLSAMISHTQLPDNSEQLSSNQKRNVSWLNIDDVWDGDIHAIQKRDADTEYENEYNAEDEIDDEYVNLELEVLVDKILDEKLFK